MQKQYIPSPWTPSTKAPVSPWVTFEQERAIIPDIEHSFTYNGVAYDQRQGIGNVPIQGQVNYEGFTVFMKISEFISLNPLRMEPLPPELRKRFESGEPIASPWMIAEIENDGSLRITSHEGRGRAILLQEQYGDIEIPVNIFIHRTPAEYIPESAIRGKIKSDTRRATYFEFTPQKVIWKKKLVTREVQPPANLTPAIIEQLNKLGYDNEWIAVLTPEQIQGLLKRRSDYEEADLTPETVSKLKNLGWTDEQIRQFNQGEVDSIIKYQQRNVYSEWA